VTNLVIVAFFVGLFVVLYHFVAWVQRQVERLSPAVGGAILIGTAYALTFALTLAFIHFL
jgi:hypothetical protein